MYFEMGKTPVIAFASQKCSVVLELVDGSRNYVDKKCARRSASFVWLQSSDGRVVPCTMLLKRTLVVYFGVGRPACGVHYTPVPALVFSPRG